jgi:zinc protease
MRIGRLAPWLSLLVAPFSIAAPTTPPAAAPSAPLIPHEKFMLDNGLTVIVAPDHKAPIVAVNVWYHVGSKNERAGKTGFAHLFEHLMFQGSENFNDEYFKPFEQVGATSQNGRPASTAPTIFRTCRPRRSISRCGWNPIAWATCSARSISPRLDEQRGVVQNEKRQNENRPYGRVFERLLAATYPVGHPYHWLPIGSMDDLNAASLDDVKEWFRTYYGAANAVLVLAGDIDTPRARELAQKYFGDIPPGPAITRPQIWTGERTESTRDVMHDQVAQTRLYRAWNIPATGTEDADLLDIAAQILGGGKTSRLFEKLVYRDQIADNAFAGTQSMEIAGLFLMLADVKANVAQQQVETALAQTLNDFISQGSDAGGARAREERAARGLPAGARAHRRFRRQGRRAGVVRGVRGRLELLHEDARALCVRDAGAGAGRGKTLAVARRLHARGATAAEIRERGGECGRPQGRPARHGDVSGPDLPGAAAREAQQRAAGHRRRAQRRAGRQRRAAVRCGLRGGSRSQGPAPRISRSTCSRKARLRSTRLQIAGRAESLGAELNTGSALDSSFVGVSALSERLDPSLALLADVVRNPSFPAAGDRARAQGMDRRDPARENQSGGRRDPRAAAAALR